VANVWDAMKKHQREQAERAAEPLETAPSIVQQKIEVSKPRLAVAPAHFPKGFEHDYAENLAAYYDRSGRIAEEYRELRTSLLALARDERFCYLMTSANPGEGKTVTCLNLAMVLAERQDRTTAIIDSDLRKATATKMLKSEATVGLADVLRSNATIQEVIQPTVYPNLYYLPAGKAKREEAGDLLARPEIHEVVAELRRRYDYVLFDTPPINVVSDARMLGRAAVRALLVIRMNKTHRESIDKALGLLHAANIKVDGLVLTHQKYFIPSYLYRYT